MIDAAKQHLPKDRYKYFIKTITEADELWTLIDNSGSFAMFEVNNATVLSLWSDEASIESNLTPDWIDYIPYKIDLTTLEETVLPIIRQNDYLINVFPVDAKVGHIVTLSDFVRDLNNFS